MVDDRVFEIPEPRVVADQPACWLAADLAARTEWEHHLTDDEVAEIDTALQRASTTYGFDSTGFDGTGFDGPRSDGHGLAALARWTADGFPLPTVAGLLDRVRRELVDGSGVMVLHGFPVERYSTDQLRAVWWGLGLHLGTALPQSSRGDVIGDVRDLGTGITGKAGRGYTSNVELGYHSDAADVSGLFFLRQGATGGTSGLASSVAVHNEIVRRRPDLMRLLYQPMPVSWQSNQLPGERPWYPMPVYGRVGDDVACAYVSTNLLLAHENAGAPPLTEAQVEAIRYVGQVAREPGFGLERHFGAGTMLYVNNQTVFHLRTAFTDVSDDPAQRRHLLRIFLCLPNGRELPATFAGYFGDVRAGALRGGYPTRATAPLFHTA